MKINNFLAFIINSIFCTYLGQKLPARLCSINNWLFKERRWERGGNFYERVFKVKLRKTLLPEVGDFVRSVFAKKHLWYFTREYLTKYLMESCRAELTHWIIIFSTFFFSLWNTIAATLDVFWFSVVLNMPYIIIQRYNRPRIRRLILEQETHSFECGNLSALTR